jgi:hypothetical protein
MRSDGRRTGEHRFERFVQLRQGDLGEEPQAAEIDAKDRDVDAGPRYPPRHADERAVASKDDDEVARARHLVAARGGPARRQTDERGSLRLEERLQTARFEPAGELRQHPRGRIQMMLRNEADASYLCHGSGALDVSAAFDGRPQVEQDLAVAFGPGDRRLHGRDALQS